MNRGFSTQRAHQQELTYHIFQVPSFTFFKLSSLVFKKKADPRTESTNIILTDLSPSPGEDKTHLQDDTIQKEVTQTQRGSIGSIH